MVLKNISKMTFKMINQVKVMIKHNLIFGDMMYYRKIYFLKVFAQQLKSEDYEQNIQDFIIK